MTEIGSLGAERAGEAAGFVARGLRRASLTAPTVALTFAMADGAAFALAIWFGLFATTAAPEFSGGSAAVRALIGGTGAVGLLALTGAYDTAALLRRRSSAGMALAAVALTLALGCALGGQPADALAWQMLIAAAIVGPQRLVLSGALAWVRAAGLMERRAVLAGGGAAAAELMRELGARPGNDIRVVAIFDDRDGGRSEEVVLGVPKIGRFEDLPGFCRMAEVDLVVVTLPLSAEERLAGLLRMLRVLPLPVYLSDLSRDRSFRHHASGLTAGLIQALPPSYRPQRRLAKRSFDLVVGVTALAVLWPVLLVTALAVRLDSPGPILFRQRRHGFNNRDISVLKFRTMHHDRADPEGRQVVTRGDARVTRVGRVLRRSSLDELPQLFNVIGGSLSLVGPRPHALVARSSQNRNFSEMVENYSARHRLPPGITGLAQINGWRGEVRTAEDLRQRVSHDLYYIENWSLWLDLSILLRTPISLLRSHGAY